jgi:glutamate/tyrosine decarboxylase-like PLP-dependent enzyme
MTTDLDAAVADLARRFRAALDPPPRAGCAIDAQAMRARVDEPLPERGMPAAGILAELEERCEPGLAGTTGGRYFGYITGGVLPGAALVQAWAAAVDQNVGLWPLSPAGAELEQVTLRWLAELLDYPYESGVFTSGATLANTVGIAVARTAFGRRHGVDVVQDGVGALPPYAVYGSAELHISDHKALRALGLGSACVRHIPLDERYRMRVHLLREAIERDRAQGIEPLAVIATAGSVNTGASDPLRPIAEVCEEHRTWLHVDGAFGAFFRLYERTAPLVDGLERADSIGIDGHKWLNLPHGTGFALLRHAALHRETFALSAPYLTPGSGENLHEYGIEASRSWRGVAAWAALKELGHEGVAALVARCCGLTAELAQRVAAAPRLELTAPVPSCVCCFRYRPEGWADGEALDELNRTIQREVAAAGAVFWTGAALASGFSQRAAIVHWRTTSDDVAALVAAVEDAGARLAP